MVNDFQTWHDQLHCIDRFLAAKAVVACDELDSQAMMQSISAFMCRDVLSMSTSIAIQYSAQLTAGRRVSSVMINNGDKLLGIVTDRDFRSRVFAQAVDLDATISQVMTVNSFSISANTTVFNAALYMTEKGCHRYPYSMVALGRCYYFIEFNAS